MDDKEITATLALTRINYFSLSGLTLMYREAGSARAIVENRNNIREMFPDAPERLTAGLRKIDEAMKRAEAEM